MKNIVKKELCTGCTACMNICPKHAISMLEDSEGFKYPVINEKKCINCGLCKKTCPVLNTIHNSSINMCYIGYSKDKNERFSSSSGALFSVIANNIINKNGIVIGASFDDNNVLKHIAIEKKDELKFLKKSKYVQSDLSDIFQFVKNNILKRKVLFVGTPCQIAGLKAYLKKDYDNLFCIDLFCHGVPSPIVFKKYINELEQKAKDKLINYDFRDNSSGWENYSNTAIFNNKKISELRINNDYMKLFLSDTALRESCFNCNFKLGNKYSDITLGDFWGVNNYYPEMYTEEGVSAIIINTKKGNEFFKTIKNEIEYKKCKIEEIIDGNPSLIKSAIKPKNKDCFFNDVNSKSIKQLVKKYVVKRRFYKKVISRLKRMIRKN